MIKDKDTLMKTRPGFEESMLWKGINRRILGRDALKDIGDFKSSAVNFRIALWDPEKNGMKYLKFLGYMLAQMMSEREIAFLKKTKNRDYGKPISVRNRGLDLCIDYMQAAMEARFISENMKLDRASVVEIGAGYGRTCHLIMSNFDIDEYIIIDTDRCLQLSRLYLSKVLPRRIYSRIEFMSPSCAATAIGKCDLCLNIDSFAEMDRRTIRQYLSLVDRVSKNLYVKNPLGKYRIPGPVNGRKNSEIGYALMTGGIIDVIDIFDSDSIYGQVEKYIRVYRPGDAWKCAAHSWAGPWSYYWQAFFRKTG
jgi:putative sugar O-methyltransferase